MSKRNKLEKFSELVSFLNVYEYSEKGYESGLAYNGLEDMHLLGQWREAHFKNDNPLVLELACGRGEYTLALAEMYPDKNFVGLDVKGARIWQGAKKALTELPNAAFLRIRIEHIAHFFKKEEVDEIWITFPDPFLKTTKSNRRLTSPEFLDRYQNVLKNGGIINLKTDDDTLYHFTLDTISKYDNAELLYHNDDIYSGDLYSEELNHKTYYERKHLKDNKTIKYIRYRLWNH